MSGEHPRLIRGALNVFRKDGPPTKGGALFANTSLGPKIQEAPKYWDKLHEMIYGGGRLRKYATIVEDIVEKFSFLDVARDQIKETESRRDPGKMFYTQYHTYAYVFMTKSFLDACAVFINESYGLKQRGSNISLEKNKLIESLENHNLALAKQLQERQSWIETVVRYRNNLIHRHGLYVGPVPAVPESITDPVAVDEFILEQPAYMPNHPDFVIDKVYEGEEGEFIKVVDMVDEWMIKSLEIFNIVLSSFTFSFEVTDPIKNKPCR